ncbi:MAG TPA: sodium transporter [Porphyromonadaceae bacterium]|nr:sodium transporter [Porphyromonadaceae bacterium]
MEKISCFLGKYMAWIILAVSVLSLFVPSVGLWIDTSWISYLLMIVMFGMGLSLKVQDFRLVFLRPKDIIIGCIAQFTIMPLLALGLGSIFHLELGILVGVILVGTCPGGTSSNVITYLSGGDVALSIAMTSVNTLLAPFLTPAITYLLLSTSVDTDAWAMFVSILKVVIAPILLSLFVGHFWGKQKERVVKILPLISITAIALIVVTVISHNAEKIISTGLIVFVVVVLHNLLGYVCGFLLGILLRLTPSKKKALSIEIGMQNSGLSTSLAFSSFPNLTMATVPGAIFSIWHNISGAILAGIFRKYDEKM